MARGLDDVSNNGLNFADVPGIILTFRELKILKDEYDHEYEVFSILRSARARTSVIFAGKCSSRRHFTTSFNTNVVPAITRYLTIILRVCMCSESIGLLT